MRRTAVVERERRNDVLLYARWSLIERELGRAGGRRELTSAEMTQPQRRQTFTSTATTKQQPQHTLTLDVLTTRPRPRPSVRPACRPPPTQPHRLHRSHSAAGGRCAPAPPPSRPRFGGLLTLTSPVPLLLPLLRPPLAGAAEGAAVRDSPQPPSVRPPARP